MAQKHAEQPIIPLSAGGQGRQVMAGWTRTGGNLDLALAAELHGGAVVPPAQHVVREDAVHARVVPQRCAALLRQPDLRQVPQPRPAPPRLGLLHSRRLVELHPSADQSACASVSFMHPSRTLRPPRRSFINQRASESGINVASLGGMRGHAGCAGGQWASDDRSAPSSSGPPSGGGCLRASSRHHLGCMACCSPHAGCS